MAIKEKRAKSNPVLLLMPQLLKLSFLRLYKQFNKETISNKNPAHIYLKDKVNLTYPQLYKFLNIKKNVNIIPKKL